jgi:peptide deformylase
MKIITIPHPTLRKTAATIKTVDEKLVKFVNNLEKTLVDSREPRGVGLAATQVDQLWRVFTTDLPEMNAKQSSRSFTKTVRHFINPQIKRACKRKKVLGIKRHDPDLEGCLSMPRLYGPVPRHRWVELEFQTLGDDGQLIDHQERFDGFAARVIQHELDHLDGILFTDYSLEHDLPVYRLSDDGKQLLEIDKKLIEVI